MSTPAVINGISYNIPATGDQNWGPDVTNWILAATTGMLQKQGGTFTLTADADFGANFGLKSLYYKSRTTNASASGVLRLATTEAITWRNNANGADLSLATTSSDWIQWQGVDLVDKTTTQTLTNKTLTSPSFSNPTITGVLTTANGTAGAPSLQIGGDLKGLYHVTTNTLGFATNGVQVGSVDGTGLWTVGSSSAVNAGSGLLNLNHSTSSGAGPVQYFNLGGTHYAGFGVDRAGNAVITGASAGDWCHFTVNQRVLWSTDNATSISGQISSGLWTLGKSGETGNHTVNGSLTPTKQYLGVNGSAGTPTYSSTSQTNYGMFFTASSLVLSTAGTAALTLNSTQDVTVASRLIVNTDPGSSYVFGQKGAFAGKVAAIIWNTDSGSNSQGLDIIMASSASNAGGDALGIFNGNGTTQIFKVSIGGNTIIGPNSIATSATDGFAYMPTCAGTPTGVPTAVTGHSAMIYDTSANKIWFYNGAWRSVAVA